MADNDYGRLLITQGYKVKIPSIFINHKVGEKLKELVEGNTESSVMIKITFDNKKTEKVNVVFWLQARSHI